MIIEFIQDFFHENISKIYFKLFVLIVVGLFGFIFALILSRIIQILVRNTFGIFYSNLVAQRLKSPFHLILTITFFNAIEPALKFPTLFGFYLNKVLFIGFVVAVAFLLIKLTEFLKDIIYFKNSLELKNNLSNRKIRTQIDFLQKTLSVFIVIIAIAAILMSFNRVKEIGASLIASAGIASIIIGLAAQKSIANLLAGLQIAFTQPVRIDDVVIVENEWGRIEEITLTYVVVRLWDLRRLVLPISYFIEKPFQNWTRMSSEIIGSVFIYADYSLDVEALRKEFNRLLNESDLWDKKVAALQVTDTTEKTIQLRAIMSASDAPTAWDLRCIIREKLILYIQKDQPASLPKFRAEPFELRDINEKV